MWGFLIGIGSAILGFFQGGIDAVVSFLAWAVAALQAGAVLLWNGLKDVGVLLKKGFIDAWDFLSDPWDNLLKPAWQKFWKWFDELRTWLNTTFGPILDWLKNLRTELLNFWATYVRPWLDLIDVTRKLLNTLASLGLAWAKQLDQELGTIEQAIEKPFQYVLGKLNEIINAVNLIMTADGLLQRIALIRSLARDYQFAWNAIAEPYTRKATEQDRLNMAIALAQYLIEFGVPADVAVAFIMAAYGSSPPPTPAQEFRALLQGGGAAIGPLVDEMVTTWRNQLQAQQ